MGWRIVKQPNGLYASFSEVVDDFTDMDMTRDEAFECCRYYCGVEESTRKIKNADDELDRDNKPGGKLSRWKKAVSIVRMVHGRNVAKQRIRTGNKSQVTPTR